MTLEQAIKQTLALIEELDESGDAFTSDPDIEAKIRWVVHQVQMELSRIKKIPRYLERPISAGEVITFDDIKEQIGKAVYQLDKVGGIDYRLLASGTVIKAAESGTAEIECFVYPDPITEETDMEKSLELSEDALSILPYGVAADLLKSDVSSGYGKVYAERYNEAKMQLDIRYNTGSMSVEGGVAI